LRVALCVLVDDLPLVASLCEMAPEVPIALDHCGFADLSGPAEELFALADQPNLRLKVTTTLLEPVRASGGDPREVVERLCEGFGVERLMWGSDYPQHHHEPYPDIVELARHSASRLAPDEQARFLGGTALELWPELTPPAN
jgi:L-fuconolactonase